MKYLKFKRNRKTDRQRVSQSERKKERRTDKQSEMG